MIEKISFQDCKTQLLDKAGSAGARAYEEWRNRRGWEDVVTFVEGFTHQVLLTLQPTDLKKVMLHSEHALGDVQKEERIKEIEDFTCPFALQHVFHHYLETSGHVPTWQQFDKYVRDTAKHFWMDPMRDFCRTNYRIQTIRKNSPIGWESINRAIRWRLGKFYYSAVREIDLFVRLRNSGLKVYYHIFADVLLRVDLWRDNDLVCVYFRNKDFRDQDVGRKKAAAEFFNDEKSKFKIHHLDIERQGGGRFWIASEESVKKLINVLN